MTTHTITSARIRQRWRPTMARLGFQREGARFVSDTGPIRHTVAVQRLRYGQESPEFLLNLYVQIRNPFELGTLHELQIFTPAYLERGGVHPRIRMRWPGAEALEAHTCFEAFGPTFFQRFQDLRTLIEVANAASQAYQHIQEYLAGPYPPLGPDDAAAAELLGHWDLVRAASPPQVPDMNYELLSLLHWHTGDAVAAMQATQHLLDANQGSSQYALDTRQRMERRLETMRRRPDH